MRVSDKAIVLQRIRHGERQNILKLYTKSHGLVTVIASPGKSPSSRIRSAVLQPLTLLDVVYTMRENHDIMRLSEASCYYVHERLSQSMVRLAIAQFMNEVLIKCVKEQNPNLALFGFLEGCLNYLNDADRDYHQLHLYFLRELARHLGFEPHNNYSQTEPFFDMREGGFSAVSLAFPLGLGRDDSLLFSGFLSGNPLLSAMPPQQRSWILEILLAYYRLHVPNFNELKSLPVLRELGT